MQGASPERLCRSERLSANMHPEALLQTSASGVNPALANSILNLIQKILRESTYSTQQEQQQRQQQQQLMNDQPALFGTIGPQTTPLPNYHSLTGPPTPSLNNGDSDTVNLVALAAALTQLAALENQNSVGSSASSSPTYQERQQPTPSFAQCANGPIGSSFYTPHRTPTPPPPPSAEELLLNAMQAACILPRLGNMTVRGGITSASAAGAAAAVCTTTSAALLMRSSTDPVVMNEFEKLLHQAENCEVVVNFRSFPRYAASFSASNFGRPAGESLERPLAPFGSPKYFDSLRALPGDQFHYIARSVARYRRLSRLDSGPSVIVSVNLCGCCNPHPGPVTGVSFPNSFWKHEMPAGSPAPGSIDTFLSLMLIELHPDLEVVEFLDRRLPAVIRQHVGNRLDRNFVVQVGGVSYMRSHLGTVWKINNLPECTEYDMLRLKSHPLYRNMLSVIASRQLIPKFANLNLCPIQFTSGRPVPVSSSTAAAIASTVLTTGRHAFFRRASGS